jgi:hypothetical protein
MKQNRFKGDWMRSSSTPNRDERMKAHEEFQMSELKKMLDEGWEITSARVKRPRIKKPKTPKEVYVSIFGGKVKMTFAEYKQHGNGMKVLMEIF